MQKEKIIKPKTLPGFMELLPEKQILFNQMVDKIRKSYEMFGFLPLDTPIIEYSEILLAKAGGETKKQIYRFSKGENDISLRFDLTVPLAKFISMHQNEIAFPFRRYQIGKVYRGEKPQKGRYREFYQCDIDIVGDGNLDIIFDAEMPSIIYYTFNNLGFSDFTIHINNRKILNGFFEELNLQEKITDILRIIDKIEKIGLNAVKEELKNIKIETEKIEKIINFININGTNSEKLNKLIKLEIKNETFLIGIKELKEVLEYTKRFGVPENNLKLDLTIARGLDYYTGTVYETFLNQYKQLGSICSGGRYDNLAKNYTEKAFPGVGISIGLSRLFYQLSQLNLIKEEKKSIAQVLVISMDENIDKCIEISNILRNNNIPTEVYLQNKKIKSKFKYADKLKIPYVVVIGEEEIKNNNITLKNMETGKQEELKIEEAIKKLKK